MLQTKLGVGETSVQCSQCKNVFAVEVRPQWMPPQLAPPVQRSRKKPKPGEGHLPPATTAYNLFMKWELRRLYKEQPLTGRPGEKQDVMRRAAAGWHDSPMNPKNAPAEPPTPQELLEVLSKRLNEGAAKLVADQLIALADKDGSGEISRDELRDAIVKMMSGKGGGKEQAEALERAFDAWLANAFLPAALASVKKKKHLQVAG